MRNLFQKASRLTQILLASSMCAFGSEKIYISSEENFGRVYGFALKENERETKEDSADIQARVTEGKTQVEIFISTMGYKFPGNGKERELPFYVKHTAVSPNIKFLVYHPKEVIVERTSQEFFMVPNYNWKTAVPLEENKKEQVLDKILGVLTKREIEDTDLDLFEQKEGYIKTEIPVNSVTDSQQIPTAYKLKIPFSGKISPAKPIYIWFNPAFEIKQNKDAKQHFSTGFARVGSFQIRTRFDSERERNSEIENLSVENSPEEVVKEFLRIVEEDGDYKSLIPSKGEYQRKMQFKQGSSTWEFLRANLNRQISEQRDERKRGNWELDSIQEIFKIEEWRTEQLLLREGEKFSRFRVMRKEYEGPMGKRLNCYEFDLIKINNKWMVLTIRENNRIRINEE